MSDNYLRLIPIDPRYVPPESAAAAGVGLISRALPEADVVTAERHDRPVFIDQGANLEVIVCPACRIRLVLNGPTPIVKEWWYELADRLEGQGVSDVEVDMPCCGARVGFPQLEFDWPAGVASFEISIRNPGIGDPLDLETMAQLEVVLGCHLRQVWAHY